MIDTNPTYLSGDYLKVMDYWKCALDRTRLYRIIYKSKWSWFKNTMKCQVLPIVFFMEAIFTGALLYSIIGKMDIDPVVCIIFFTAIPFTFAAILLISTYFDSFIAAKRDERRLLQFVDDYFNGCTIKYDISPTNKIIDRCDLEFEIAYTSIYEKNQRGEINQLKKHRCLVIGTYFEHPKEDFWAEDNELAIRDFISNFQIYCEGKQSCSNLALDAHIIYATYDVKFLPTPDDFAKVLDEIAYIMKRFKLLPLKLSTVEE